MIRIKYNVLVFLYAYLRQIDLSLDRSRWQPWHELQAYYSCRPQPSTVSTWLLKELNLTLETNTVVSFHKPLFSEKVKMFLARLIFNIYIIREDDILLCCQMLNRFSTLLARDLETYSSEAEQLRIEFAKFYSNVLEHSIGRKDLRRAIKIEHFFQSERLDLVKLTEFTNVIGLE